MARELSDINLSGELQDIKLVNTDANSSVATKQNVIDLAAESVKDAMNWKGEWDPGNPDHLANEVVRDGSWTMVANADTSDRPAPQVSGEPENYSPDTFGSNLSHGGVVISGQRYQFSEARMLEEIWAYIPDVNPLVDYHIVAVDNTGITPISRTYQVFPQKVGWNKVMETREILITGADVTISLMTSDNTDLTATPIYYNYKGVASQNPGDGGWNTNPNGQLLRLSLYESTDSPGTGLSKQTELEAIQAGTEIKITAEADSGKTGTWLVTEVTDDPVSQDVLNITVAKYDATGDDFILDELCLLEIINSATAASPYVRDDAWWTSNMPSYCDIDGVLSFDDVDQSGVDTHAFGVDIVTQAVIASPDWDILAVSDISTNSSLGSRRVRALETEVQTIYQNVLRVVYSAIGLGNWPTKTNIILALDAQGIDLEPGGRFYLTDGNKYFFVVYDGTDYYFEKFSKAT